MTRADAQRLFYTVLDGQATPTETRDFHAYLTTDTELAAAFKSEQVVVQAMRARLKRANTQTASSRLRNSISAALDAVDREEALIPVATKTVSIAPKVRLLPAVKWMAYAASLILAVGVGYFAFQIEKHNDAFLALESAHWEAVSEFQQTGKFVHTTEAGKCHESAKKMAGTLGLKLADAEDGLPEIGGCINECTGKALGHYVYAEGDKIVSVFVAPAASFEIPADLLKHPVHKDGQTLYDHNCRGCRLVYQRVGDVIVITATTNRKVELLDFEPVVI